MILTREITTWLFSAFALVVSFLSYEQSEAERAFMISIESDFSTETTNGVENAENFIIRRTNGQAQALGAEIYSAITYIDTRDGNEKLIPIYYISETKKNKKDNDILFEMTGKNNNIENMEALIDIRKNAADIIQGLKIIHLFKVIYRNENSEISEKYFIHSNNDYISETSEKNYNRIYEKYASNLSKIINIKDLNHSNIIQYSK